MIVGVHGIAQQQLTRPELLQSWEPALRGGLEKASGRTWKQIPFDVAHYGDLYLPGNEPADGDSSSSGSARKASTSAPDDPADLKDLDGEELAALESSAHEIVPEPVWRAAEAAGPAKGLPPVPRPLQVVLRAMDDWLGPAAGVLYVGTFRQVRRYLVNEAVKSRIDQIVADAVTGDCRILIGHSLGSVVALEYLRQHPDHHLDLFLTLGSPLGLNMVQAGLPVSSYGARHRRGIPDSVATWVNVRDPRDPVACAGDLHRWWSGVQDRHVHNGSNSHSVTRYLGKKQTGSAILAALPPLPAQPAPPEVVGP